MEVCKPVGLLSCIIWGRGLKEFGREEKVMEVCYSQHAYFTAFLAPPEIMGVDMADRRLRLLAGFRR